jgi:outer membrane protein OmpA-like peptidoglycan-associated protein
MVNARVCLALCLALPAAACDKKPDGGETTAPRSPPKLDPVYFDAGEAKLSFADKPAVQQAIAELERDPSLHVLLIGRTDSRGSANKNMQLGMQRAGELREAILNRAAGKVAFERVHIGSRGQAEPTGDNNTDAGRAANRRVEFYFYVPDGTPLRTRFPSPIQIDGE